MEIITREAIYNHFKQRYIDYIQGKFYTNEELFDVIFNILNPLPIQGLYFPKEDKLWGPRCYNNDLPGNVDHYGHTGCIATSLAVTAKNLIDAEDSKEADYF